MSMAAAPYCPPEWLALREPADAGARAPEPLAALRDHLAGTERPVIRDLGCGTGSMTRWLAARLPGPQHWVLHDRDTALLAHAAASMPATAGDGGALTFVTERRDVARPADLAGTSLLTASALLDLLTAEEVDGLAAACAEAGCPALLTLSVTGRVTLTPAEPFDAAVEQAFNDHQRRVNGGRRLLGPDAVEVTAAAFERRGATVERHPSPWTLGPDQAALTAEWLAGRVEAARAQRPELADEAGAYLRRRLELCAAGGLHAVVDHEDLLVLPEALS